MGPASAPSQSPDPAGLRTQTGPHRKEPSVSLQIRRVQYYTANVADRIGSAYEVLSELAWPKEPQKLFVNYCCLQSRWVLV